MLWYLNLVAVAAATALHLWLGKRPVTGARVVEVVLLYLLVIFAGVGGLIGFLGHTFKAQEIALKIGWQPSPFQFEVAVANLAFGVLGILCLWQPGGFRTATGLGYAIFLLGCASGHLKEMIMQGNLLPITSARYCGSMTWPFPAPFLLCSGCAAIWPSPRLTLPRPTDNSVSMRPAMTGHLR